MSYELGIMSCFKTLIFNFLDIFFAFGKYFFSHFAQDFALSFSSCWFSIYKVK